MRVAIILIVAIWGIVGVVGFVATRRKPLDSKVTAFYILVYPVLVVILFLNEPVPLLIVVPTLFGVIPWLLAGPHLWSILKDPRRSRVDQVIGIHRFYWLWGGMVSIALGFVSGWFVIL